MQIFKLNRSYYTFPVHLHFLPPSSLFIRLLYISISDQCLLWFFPSCSPAVGRLRRKRRISFSFNLSPILTKSKSQFIYGDSSSSDDEDDFSKYWHVNLAAVENSCDVRRRTVAVATWIWAAKMTAMHPDQLAASLIPTLKCLLVTQHEVCAWNAS